MLIMVVVAMVALLAFGAFVIDYGMMWTGRGQVQTSADAGALAGAISLAFDSPTDFAGAKTKASWAARANNVWGTAPDVQLTDVTFPPCPPGAPGLADTCVKVDAFRNQDPRQPVADLSSAISWASRIKACGRPPPRRSSPATRRTASSRGPSSTAGRSSASRFSALSTLRQILRRQGPGTAAGRRQCTSRRAPVPRAPGSRCPRIRAAGSP